MRNIDHVGYPTNGVGLTLGGTRNGVNVTTAPGWTFHGDFWNVWDQDKLEGEVADCLNRDLLRRLLYRFALHHPRPSNSSDGSRLMLLVGRRSALTLIPFL
jgi:hypothetical protein